MNFAQDTQTVVVHVRHWEEVRLIGKSLRRWLFRGQSKAEWVLKSTLERAFEERELPVIPEYPVEDLILSEFKSAAHLFSANTPRDEDTIAWLSLIQHHGGPTRLLDFTESFYVAAYFALDDATDNCAIWAFNRIDFMKRVSNIIDSLSHHLKIDRNISTSGKLDIILIHAIRGDVEENKVITMAPSQRNERQYIQKGLAVIPLSLQEGYMGAILGSFDPPGKMPDENLMQEVGIEELLPILKTSKIVKIIMSKACFLNARIDLEQMNINSTTLFRGLDGLGKNLKSVFNSIELHIREKITEPNG